MLHEDSIEQIRADADYDDKLAKMAEERYVPQEKDFITALEELDFRIQKMIDDAEETKERLGRIIRGIQESI